MTQKKVEKVLNTLEIDLILHTKAFVIIASRRLLYGETSDMHCSGVILAHSSTTRFLGPFLQTLKELFNSLHRL